MNTAEPSEEEIRITRFTQHTEAYFTHLMLSGSISAIYALYSLLYAQFKKWTPEELHLLETKAQISLNRATTKLEQSAIAASKSALANFVRNTDIPVNSPKYNEIITILTDNIEIIRTLADKNTKYRSYVSNADASYNIYNIIGSSTTNNLKIQSPDKTVKYSLEPISTSADPNLPVALSNMKLVIS